MKHASKRIVIAALTAALLLIFSFGAAAVAHGDVNGDNEVNAADARLALRIAVSYDDSDTEPNYHPEAADAADPFGEINAADARMILRAAVGLEDLSEQHIPAEPVRENETPETATEHGGYDTVVYCSVCGAELSREHHESFAHTHKAGEPQIENETPATCAEPGGYDTVIRCELCNEVISSEHTETPKLDHTPGEPARENETAATCAAEGGYDLVVRCTSCGLILSSERVLTPKTDHVWGEPTYQGDPAAACADTVTMIEVCTVCGELRTQVMPAQGHDIDLETFRCRRCGSQAAAFNSLVNPLKDGTHYYTGFERSKNSGEVLKSKFKISLAARAAAALAGEKLDEDTIKKMFTEEMTKEQEIWQNRTPIASPINNRSFHVKGAPYVSMVKDGDVQSITVESADKVDFIAGLPDKITFTTARATYTESIAETIKSAVVEDVKKVTVVMKPTRYTEIKNSTEETGLQRIIGYDLREVAGDFNQKTDEDGAKFEMTCNELQCDLTVTYYYDPITASPLCATYDMLVTCDQSIVVDVSVSGVSMMSGEMRVKLYNASTEYYFFDGVFE